MGFFGDPRKIRTLFEPPRLQEFTTSGLKSLRDPITLTIRPLTVICGANSSGKSTALQTLLLLKQTAESQHDPGALRLNGDCVHLPDWSAALWAGPNPARALRVDLKFHNRSVGLTFSGDPPDVTRIDSKTGRWEQADGIPLAVRDRLDLHLQDMHPDGVPYTVPAIERDWFSRWIHVPGLRGLPERVHGRTGTGPYYAGPFTPYPASHIAEWARTGDPRSATLSGWLERLGLTARVTVEHRSSTEMEVKVARIADGRQLINLADVGIGVSQVLPVLVALLAASPEHLVIIEQPELHLHPRAQAALGDILAEAATTGGPRIIIETHSAILLRRLQTLVAQDTLPPEALALHWFSRGTDGATRVDTVQLDTRGAYGEWPEDFSEIEADVDQAYIDAATAKL